jgi:hypothetical protein
MAKRAAERDALETEERVPKQSDKGAPLVRIVAHYEDGSAIAFGHDTKAARRASKIKKGKSEEGKKKKK